MSRGYRRRAQVEHASPPRGWREPDEGETVKLSATRIEGRTAFLLESRTGWRATFATRRAALEFAQQKIWNIGSLLDDEVVA